MRITVHPSRSDLAPLPVWFVSLQRSKDTQTPTNVAACPAVQRRASSIATRTRRRTFAERRTPSKPSDAGCSLQRRISTKLSSRRLQLSLRFGEGGPARSRMRSRSSRIRTRLGRMSNSSSWTHGSIPGRSRQSSAFTSARCPRCLSFASRWILCQRAARRALASVSRSSFATGSRTRLRSTRTTRSTRQTCPIATPTRSGASTARPCMRIATSASLRRRRDAPACFSDRALLAGGRIGVHSGGALDCAAAVR
jgi:hypothetical protein